METRKITKVLLQISMVYAFIMIVLSLSKLLPTIIERTEPSIAFWLVTGIIIVLPLIVLYLLSKDSKYAGIVGGIPILYWFVDNLFSSRIDSEVLMLSPILVISNLFFAFLNELKASLITSISMPI